MKKIIALAIAAAAIGPVSAATSVGISIGINQPGVYGRINIGDVPRPALVYEQPMIIAPPPVMYERRPIYLYVPPLHQQDWRRYCGRYNACGQPVYFVQDQWVRERYQQEHPGWNRGRGRGWNQRDDDHRDRDHGRGPDRHDRDNGPGNGHGSDRGRDH
ncbi:MAG: hypothetical protein QFE16_08930 [Pseudomonadota bacterium]|nr:hypothetical protein [Pseudomonadota bacterium]